MAALGSTFASDAAIPELSSKAVDMFCYCRPEIFSYGFEFSAVAFREIDESLAKNPNAVFQAARERLVAWRHNEKGSGDLQGVETSMPRQPSPRPVKHRLLIAGQKEPEPSPVTLFARCRNCRVGYRSSPYCLSGSELLRIL